MTQSEPHKEKGEAFQCGKKGLRKTPARDQCQVCDSSYNQDAMINSHETRWLVQAWLPS